MAGSERKRQKQRESSTYTISVLEHVTLVSEWRDLDDETPRVPVTAEADLWRDVATVTVPAGSKVETVIRQAVEDAGLDRSSPVSLRVLDERSGRVHVVSWEQPPARLKIGE
jgi:hypothetical protein